MDPAELQPNGSVRRDVALALTREDAWEALTTSDRLSAWFEAEVEIDPRPRGKVRSVSPDGAIRHGMVVSCNPPFRLVLVWEAAQDSSGNALQPSRVEFTIQTIEGATVLTVIESALSESAPEVLLQQPMR